MTSSSVVRQGALQATSHDWFRKNDHDFLILIHSKFLSAMHGFREGFIANRIWRHRDFSNRQRFTLVLMTESREPSVIIMVYCHISRMSYRFEVFRHCILPFPTHFRDILGVKYPTFHNYTFLTPAASVELLCTKIGSWAWAVSLLKKQKSHRTSMLPPRGVSTAHRIQTKFVRAGNLPKRNHPHQIWNQLAMGWSVMF